MRTTYNSESKDFWKKAYLSQQGNGYYVGQQFQRGTGIGSFFKGLFRSIFPIFKSVGKEAAKQALTAGVGVASDYLSGADVKQSLRKRGRQAVGNTLENSGTYIKEQGGEGIGNRNKLRADIFGNYG